MTARAFSGSFWPTERQKLLLRAALFEDERGIEAWRRLRPDFDLDELDFGEQLLLPLVYQRLQGLGFDDPARPRLRGLYRRTWYLNQLLLDRLKEALRAVEESKSDPLVVNGWELPARYYDDLGLRRVEQLHLLVRPERVGHAARCLSDAGWSGALEPSDAFLRGKPQASYTALNGDVCVLWWRLFPEFTTHGRIEAEDPFAPAIEFDLAGVPTRALCPSDELLNVCITSARRTHWPSLMWIADAVVILRAPAADIDWGRLVRQATRLRATLRIYDALSFLQDEFDCDVPAGVLDELRSVPTRPREVVAHRAAAVRLGALGPVPDTVTRFLRLTAATSLPRALVGLPSFLRDDWGLERRSQVPYMAARRSGAMLAGAARVAKLRRARRSAQAARRRGDSTAPR